MNSMSFFSRAIIIAQGSLSFGVMWIEVTELFVQSIYFFFNDIKSTYKSLKRSYFALGTFHVYLINRCDQSGNPLGERNKQNMAKQ